MRCRKGVSVWEVYYAKTFAIHEDIGNYANEYDVEVIFVLQKSRDLL